MYIFKALIPFIEIREERGQTDGKQHRNRSEHSN
jgi:hypothetical protein